MSEELYKCSICETELTEDMIKDWDNCLCEDCWIDQGINSMEAYYDRD